jgi:polyhydroxyalkanoate synthesis regulator phasin
VSIPNISCFAAVLALFVAVAGVSAAAEEPLEKLIAKAEAGGDKQAELYVDVAQRYAAQASQHFSSGESDKANDDIRNIISYAEKARSVVGRSEGRIKKTEMKMHKLHRRLEEVARATDADDRPPVTAAAQHVEELRSQLLDLLFRKDK